MLEIEYEIEPIFKIEFFKIKCIDFKNKKEHIEKILKQLNEIKKKYQKLSNQYQENKDGNSIPLN